jgi:hypothetical protein
MVCRWLLQTWKKIVLITLRRKNCLETIKRWYVI